MRMLRNSHTEGYLITLPKDRIERSSDHRTAHIVGKDDFSRVCARHLDRHQCSVLRTLIVTDGRICSKAVLFVPDFARSRTLHTKWPWLSRRIFMKWLI